MEDSNKTLVELIYEMREEVGMPKFAFAEEVVYMGTQEIHGHVLGYPDDIKGIVLLCVTQNVGHLKEYLQHNNWVKEVEEKIGKIDSELYLIWAGEKQLHLVLKDD